MIINDVNGFLVDDAIEMAEKIEYLINFPLERERLGIMAAQRFAYYSQQNIDQQWLKVISDLIDHRVIVEDIPDTDETLVYSAEELADLKKSCLQKLKRVSLIRAKEQSTKLSFWEVVKAYLLFPYYIHRIYKIIQKNNSKRQNSGD